MATKSNKSSCGKGPMLMVAIGAPVKKKADTKATKKYNTGGDVKDSRIKSATILSRSQRRGMEENGLEDEYLTAKPTKAAEPSKPARPKAVIPPEVQAKRDAQFKKLMQKHTAPLK